MLISDSLPLTFQAVRRKMQCRIPAFALTITHKYILATFIIISATSMPQGSTGFPAFADDREILDCRALLRRARNDGRGWGIYLAIDKREMAFPQPSLRDRSVREAARMDCRALLRRARNDGKNIAS